MEPFTVHRGSMLPLRRSNVDTDQIIPAEYLKRITRHGYEDGLFAAWRRDPEFVLNDPRFGGATVLVAGPEFGTGSSREHAAWALQDAGFRVIVSSRFADIFRSNCAKVGLLTAQISQDAVDDLWDIAESSPSGAVVVDLDSRTIATGEHRPIDFDIDDYARWRLLNGFDDIGLTLRNEASITAFEARRPTFLPTTI